METLLNDKWLMFFIEMFLKSTVIFLFVLATVNLMKNKPASFRHFVLLLGFVCVFLLPFTSSILPKNGFALFTKKSPIKENIEKNKTITYTSNVVYDYKGKTFNKFVSSNEVLNKEDLSKSFLSILKENKLFLLYAIYMIGIALFLIKIFIGLTKINSLTVKGEKVDGSPWTEFLSIFIKKTGFSKKVKVVKNNKVSVPMTWSLKSNFIILPKNVDNWSEKQKAAAFLHELSHILRRDFMIFMFAKATCILFWFNPLSFIALRKLRFEQENSCDELVVSLGLKASSYALSLLEIGKSIKPNSSLEATALCMAKKSELQKRLTTILENKSYFKEIKMKTKLIMSIVIFIGFIMISSTSIYSTGADFSKQFEDGHNVMFGVKAINTQDNGEIDEVEEPEEVKESEEVKEVKAPKAPKVVKKPEKIKVKVNVDVEDVDMDDNKIVYTDKDGKTHVVKSKSKVLFVDDNDKVHEIKMKIHEKEMKEQEKKMKVLEEKMKKMEKELALKHKKMEEALKKIESKKVKKELQMAMKEYEKALKSAELARKEALKKSLEMKRKERHERIILEELAHNKEHVSKEEIEKIIKEAKKNMPDKKEIEKIIKEAKKNIPSKIEIEKIVKDIKKNKLTDEEIEVIVKNAKELKDLDIELNELKNLDKNVFVLKGDGPHKIEKKIIIKSDGDDEDEQVYVFKGDGDTNYKVWTSKDDDEDVHFHSENKDGKQNVWVSKGKDGKHKYIEINKGECKDGKLMFVSEDGEEMSTTEVLHDKKHKGDLKLKFNKIDGNLRVDKDIEFKKKGEKTGLNIELNLESDFSKANKKEIEKLIKKFKKQLPSGIKVDYNVKSKKCEIEVKSKKEIEGKVAEDILQNLKDLEKNISKLVNK